LVIFENIDYEIYKEEGVKGLLRGWHLRVLGLIPYYFAFFNIYEKSQQFFKNKYLDKGGNE
jgi:hypothetical protein